VKKWREESLNISKRKEPHCAKTLPSFLFVWFQKGKPKFLNSKFLADSHQPNNQLLKQYIKHSKRLNFKEHCFSLKIQCTNTQKTIQTTEQNTQTDLTSNVTYSRIKESLKSMQLDKDWKKDAKTSSLLNSTNLEPQNDKLQVQANKHIHWLVSDHKH